MTKGYKSFSLSLSLSLLFSHPCYVLSFWYMNVTTAICMVGLLCCEVMSFGKYLLAVCSGLFCSHSDDVAVFCLNWFASFTFT